MQKRTKKPLLSLRGDIYDSRMTDRGVIYSGYDARGNDLAVSVNDAGMAVSVEGSVIMVKGDYLERDNNARRYLICNKSEGDCIGFKVDDEGHFTLDYYREQGLERASM